MKEVKHTPEDNTCGDCWGSGWETQFITPCRTCNGTGRKTMSQNEPPLSDYDQGFQDGLHAGKCEDGETAAERDRLKEEIVKYQLELSDSEQERNKLKEEIRELKEKLAGRDKIIDNYGVKGRELKEENERLKNSLASEVQVKQIFTIENQKLQSINRELVEALKARKLLLEEKYAMPHLVDDYNYISDLINKNSTL